jgi:polyribonucleotide nucleotidyltransferase
MFKNTPFEHSIDYYGQKITLQTGLLAMQATASVLATIGETTVLATVVVGDVSSADYLPLQVIYEERLYASGKIKGSRFIKREGKPTENAVLTGRLIDRSLRSLFDPFIRNEVQIVITVLSLDEINPPDILSVIAASSAVSMCGISGFNGLVSCARMGIDKSNKIIANPNYRQQKDLLGQIVLSGSDHNILMIEAEGNQLSEILVDQAILDGCKELQILTNFQEEFLLKSRVLLKQSKIINVFPKSKFIDFWLLRKIDIENIQYQDIDKKNKENLLKNYLESALKIVDDLEKLIMETNPKNLIEFQQKIEYSNGDIKNKFLSVFSLVDSLDEIKSVKSNLQFGFDIAIARIIKQNILQNHKRVDGRKLDETRQITCQVGVLGRTHGSSLFQRGQTQVLSALTVGTNRDAQLLDDMEDFEEVTKNYMHHYNFPAYSVGETGRYMGPGRREIGHGALAEKALLPVLPSQEAFPYTLRLVSECLGSNGSTSMASTCASSLSLMDAGIPISGAVAGVAMGLFLDNQTGKYQIVTDIQGLEDHYGDMDFKVTGTTKGITAIQLDNKVAGLTPEILSEALLQSRLARLHILDIMEKTIQKPRDTLSPLAPVVETLNVPIDKISMVIGPSGKTIKSIIAATDTEIEIDDITGRTIIYGDKKEKSQKAKVMIQNIIRVYLPGEQVIAKIFRLETYGAFAKLDGGQKEGLIHISELGDKNKKIQDIFTIGQELRVLIKGINQKGQISLSLDK